MIEKYQRDEQYWAKYNVQPSWTYFGAHNGLFRKVPAIYQEVCGVYDPRRRPWVSVHMVYDYIFTLKLPSKTDVLSNNL